MNLLRLISGGIGALILMQASFASTKDELQIRRLYSTLATGLRTKNIKLILSTQIPNFEETAHGTVLSREEVQKQMVGQFAVTKRVKKCEITVTSLTVKDRTAVGTTNFEMEVITGATGPDDSKQTHIIDIKGTTLEHIVKTKKGWLFQSTTDESSHMTIDGRKLKGS